MSEPRLQPDPGPQFTLTEAEQSHLPAVALLMKMGYRYLPPSEALELRGGRNSRVLLEDVLRAQLRRLNRIRVREREYSFTSQNVERAVQALRDVPLAEGPQRASERAYDLLRLGISLEQQVDGETRSFTLRYVDWSDWKNNVFHVTVKYGVRCATSQRSRYPDVVLFVNGIPFAVIECKAPVEALEVAVSQILDYQGAEEIPDLFKYVQLVLGLKPGEARYATAGTPARFWSVWRADRDEDPDPEIARLLLQPLPPTESDVLLAGFVREQGHFYVTEEDGRRVTEQDRALYLLCRPERLIELSGRYIVYESGEKKIARYQQYYAVRDALRRVTSDSGEAHRPHGVIWHTQGSGKTLTMVFLAEALAQHPDIRDPRIILVTDRIDLDKQLAGTFRRCGLEPHRATSGADLRRLVRSPRASIVTALVHKFMAAVREGEVVDDSRDTFVLVDEGHRSHYGSMHQALRKVFPNGCYLAFTGTPLLSEEKNTLAKFGNLISAYTMEQAVDDGAVVPLLYERRHVDQEVVAGTLDTWFDRVCRGLTTAQQADLKKKKSRAQIVLRAQQRLWAIAYDVSTHYRDNWQRDGYFKAQLVAPDKKSAIRLHRHMKDLEWVSSEVIISPPDEPEGYEAPDERPEDIVQEFWAETMARFGNSEDRYNEEIIERFNHASSPELLIVVDKLLTGFDAPRNTVLYLTRRLSHHTLLQAIARVNRLYEGKEFGYILDYVGVLGELDRALWEYRALAGYDPQDLVGMLASVRDEVSALPARHAALLDLFKTIERKHDAEEYEALLAPEEKRKEFYAALGDFSRTLKIALSTEFFAQETPPDVVERYRDDLRRFQKLRASVQQRYADTVSLKKLEPEIEKLLDQYLLSAEVESLTPKPINIFDEAAMERALHGRTAAAQADAMAHATARTLTERMDEDPALYRTFSEMLQETIQAFRARKLQDREYLERVKRIRSDLVTRTDTGLPSALLGNDVAQAYYRVAMEHLDRLAAQPGDRDAAAEAALVIDRAIRSEIVVDWTRKPEVEKRMRECIDDGLFELSEAGRIRLDWEAIDQVAAEVFRIARSRLA